MGVPIQHSTYMQSSGQPCDAPREQLGVEGLLQGLFSMQAQNACICWPQRSQYFQFGSNGNVLVDPEVLIVWCWLLRVENLLNVLFEVFYPAAREKKQLCWQHKVVQQCDTMSYCTCVWTPSRAFSFKPGNKSFWYSSFGNMFLGSKQKPPDGHCLTGHCIVKSVLPLPLAWGRLFKCYPWFISCAKKCKWQ